MIDDQQPERAKQLYLVNLESGQLTPASSEWRDSLFGLGRLYFSQAQEVELKNPANENATIYSDTELQAQQLYQDSIRRLEEAVERYPTSSSVIQTRILSQNPIVVWPPIPGVVCYQAQSAVPEMNTTKNSSAYSMRRSCKTCKFSKVWVIAVKIRS